MREDDYEVWVRFLDAEVLVRHVPAEELLDIQRRARVRTWETTQGAPSQTQDSALAGRLLGRAAVRGWRGLSMQGQDYPYSPENCDFLITRWAEFSRFISEVSTSLRRLMEEERRASEKNSSLTSGPGSTSRV